MKNAVERAAGLAKAVTQLSAAQTAKRVQAISDTINKGSDTLKNLYGIEQRAKERLEKSIANLRQEKLDFENRGRFSSKYKELSLEPLTWRDESGWPQLAVFSLESPRFQILVTGRYANMGGWGGDSTRTFTTSIFPKLPKVLAACYDDVEKKLKTQAARNSKSVKIFCDFEGLIPEETKQRIAEAQLIFKQIFLIAEPSKGFTVNESAMIQPKEDPLVVGFDSDKLWLIDKFETTAVEEMMIPTFEGAKN